MTYLEALHAAMYPYQLPDAPYTFLLAEQGIDALGEYTHGVDNAPFYRAVVAALRQLIVLAEERDGGSTQRYDTAMIRARIQAIEQEQGLVPTMQDITPYW